VTADHLIEFIEEEIEVLRAATARWTTRWAATERPALTALFDELTTTSQFNMSKVWRWDAAALREIAAFVYFTAEGVTNGSVLQVMLWAKGDRIADYANASAVDRLSWLAREDGDGPP
jgi:hypothetical protein